MSWTAPKIQARLLKVAAPKTVALRPAVQGKPSRTVSPRTFAAESGTGYRRK